MTVFSEAVTEGPAQTPGAAVAQAAANDGMMSRIARNASGGITLQLNRPIATAQNSRQKTLALRPPVLADFDALGDPVIVPEHFDIAQMTAFSLKPAPGKLAAWLARLSTHTEVELSQISAADTKLCTFALFFMSLSDGSTPLVS
ncbi:MAG: hypothetical protein AAFO79_00195 [Pseudomonadota bacterium]